MKQNERRHGLASRSAVTLVEILLAVIMLSLLFGSAYGIMRYSRVETEKGFWIQQAITQLRNGTRAISQKLKMTSYPTTIIRKVVGTNEVQKVITYKEKREYDATGRLRKLTINPKTDFDMHAIVTDGAEIAPIFEDQSIMYFPICSPERESNSSYEEGTITWVELVLRPSREYRLTGLGSLHMLERVESYSTKSLTERAFDLNKSFKRNLPVKTDKMLIEDIRGVGIEYYDIEELRGIYVTKDGDKYEEHNKRILVSLDITCSHPKDGKIWLNDQCSVINNVGIVKLAGSNLMELVKISGKTATIKFNGANNVVNQGDPLGSYKVKEVQSKSVILVLPGSDIERVLVLKES